MAELSPLPTLAPGRYRHFKGGEYEVLDIVRSSETLQPMVLYRALYGEGGLWVRPYTMFVEQVPGEHGPQPRFARIDARWLRCRPWPAARGNAVGLRYSRTVQSVSSRHAGIRSCSRCKAADRVRQSLLRATIEVACRNGLAAGG